MYIVTVGDVSGGAGIAHQANTSQVLEVPLLSSLAAERKVGGKQLRGICIKK